MSISEQHSAKGFKRKSGVLLHITSLPSKFGVGDLGPEAIFFLDFLKASGQTIWQFLPIGPTSPGLDNSPYTSSSAFAGNPLFISPDHLYQEDLLTEPEIKDIDNFSEYVVEYEKIIPFKEGLYRKAFNRWLENRGNDDEFEAFCKSATWLQDFALYMALKDKYEQRAWYDWPRPLATREAEALQEANRLLEIEITYYKFLQYIFQKQWVYIRQKAKERSILLFGDIPIYVALDSADVWANQSFFDLDPITLRPINVAGVPPDYFSSTGQRWGNPLYKWELNGAINSELYEWWASRFKRLRELVDIVRIDHFRGFEAYWAVPAKEKTAKKGKWLKGPGKKFFDLTKHGWEGLKIVAEDLGTITPEVVKLREELGFPGMKVLQFAFDSDEYNVYLPHNYNSTNFVVYTGTHDNNTTLGWYMDPKVSEAAKARARRYANSNGANIHWDFIRIAFGSIAETAIIPMQDILGFGSDCRMNTPSTSKGNWRWRLASRFITSELADRLFDETRFYARIVPTNKRQ